MEKIHWNPRGHVARMFSGSSAEGVSLPDSDIDVMYWRKHHIVLQDKTQLPSRCNKPNILLMRPSHQSLGFTRLECLSPQNASPDVNFSLEYNGGRRYFSSRKYTEYNLLHSAGDDSINGPCIRSLSLLGGEQDCAHCLRCHFWPDDAYEYITRDRPHGWPPEPMIQQLLSDGIHLVPIGSRRKTGSGDWEHDPLEWRFSFSMAETTLIHSFNASQLRIYGLLKVILNEILKKRVPDNALCSYFMKTTVLWTIEETPEKNLERGQYHSTS